MTGSLLKVCLLFFCYSTISSYRISREATHFDLRHLLANAEEQIKHWFTIYPGTKWCGIGNVAENDDDYGPEIETDKCCQKHDHCFDTMESHETKHNLTNPSFHTRLHCKCDNGFYNCLKSVNTVTSNQVGTIYFNTLNTKCYLEEDYPKSECKEYTDFTKTKCATYNKEIKETPQYEWKELPKY